MHKKAAGLFPSNVTAVKGGAFRDWQENDEDASITLPLPVDTSKKDLVCVITAESLHVRHARLQLTLLRAEPLGGPIIPEESTWYLEGPVLTIVLAKQWRGETKSDQYWGASLAAAGGHFECYMTPAEVEAARDERELEEARLEEERRARVKAAEEASRREKEREKERERVHARVAAARRRRGQDGGDDDSYDESSDEDDTDARARSRPVARKPAGGAGGLSSMLWIFIFVAFVAFSRVPAQVWQLFWGSHAASPDEGTNWFDAVDEGA